MIWLTALSWARKGFVDQMLWLLVQYDTYARGQDMQQLCGSDVLDDGSAVAIRVGVAERGQSVKTGINQGI
eukprot:12887560-Alexandrium_andersonii.AAC.1